MKSAVVMWLVFFLLFSLLSFTHAAQPLKVIDFVVDAGGGVADNTAAFAAAVKLALAQQLPIWVPPGMYNFKQPINCTGVRIFGSGAEASVFIWNQQLGSGVAAWDFGGNLQTAWIRDMGLRSSYGRAPIGTALANFYGLRLNGPVSVENVESQTFYAGFVWNSPTGGVRQIACHGSNNYYGIYVQQSNGNNYYAEGGLEGNVFASIGIPATGSMTNGDTIYRTHLGYGPYGVYQEGPAPAALGRQTFLSDAHFQTARFEACGNGAIFTENAASSVSIGAVYGIELLNVGSGRAGDPYVIANRTQDYAVVIGGVYAPASVYFPGLNAFVSFNKGVFNIPFTGKNSALYMYNYSSIPLV